MGSGPVTPAERKRFQAWLAGQPTARLVCRIYGHWWPDSMAPAFLADKQQVPGVYTTQAACEREVDGEGCGVSRHVYVSRRDGTVATQPTYHYPDGYLLAAERGQTWDMDKLTRGQVRLELRRRNLTDAGLPA